MGERGSRRNRFWIWLQNLKKIKKQKKNEEKELKRKKEEKEKQNKNVKVYTKMEVVSKTILELSLGALETILLPKKKEENKIISIKNKTEKLQKETKQLVIDSKILNEEIKNIKTKEKQIEIKKRFDLLEQHHEENTQELFKLKEEVKLILDNEKNKKTQVENIQLDEKDKIQQETLKEVTKVEDTINTIKEENEDTGKNLKEMKKQIIELNDKKIVTKDPELDICKNYLTELNTLVLKFNEELEIIKNNVSDDNLDNSIYQIDSLYNRIFPQYQKEQSMKLQFSNIKDETIQEKLSGLKLKPSLEMCLVLKREYIQRKWNLQEQDQRKEQVIKKQKDAIVKTELMKKEIILKMRRQQVVMDKMNEGLSSLKGIKKKRSKLARLGSMMTNLLLTGFGITRFFKKKVSVFDIFLGALSTNYGIRGMRNLGKEKNDQVIYFDVKKLINELSSEQKALELSTICYQDSIVQLSELKQEFMSEYGIYQSKEIEKLKSEFELLEIELHDKMNLLTKQQEQLNYVMEKGKQKIKKIEGR